MIGIGRIIGWKFGHFAGITTSAGGITGWPNELGPLPTSEQLQQWAEEFQHYQALQDYDIAIERELDRQAEEAGYYDPLDRIPNIDRACSYAGHSNPYQAEGQSFVAWRAAVWAHVYQVKAEVEAEIRPQPTIEELIAELPQRVIPE